MKNPKNTFSSVFLLSSRKRADQHRHRWAVSILLLISFLVLMPFGHLISDVAQADQKAPGQNGPARVISEDLQTSLNNASGGLVRVIIETNALSSSQAFSKLLTKISRLGGAVSRRLSNDRYIAVQLP